MIVVRPKHIYVRSAVLLARVRALPCMVTGVYGQTQPAHSNWGGAVARRSRLTITASRQFPGRSTGNLTRACDGRVERKALWWKAHVKSVKALLAQDLWPQKVPIPDIEVYPW